MALKLAATLRSGTGNQQVPGITGPDFKEVVAAGRVLVLEVQPKVSVKIGFLNDGANETSVMVHRKLDPILGTWENVARKGNGGGKDYQPYRSEPINEAQILVISGWHKNQGDDLSTQPWHQSAHRCNEDDYLELANGGMQYSAGFEDGGGGNDFNEPHLTITCQFKLP